MPLSELSLGFLQSLRADFPGGIRSLNLARNRIREVRNLEVVALELISVDLSWNRIADLGLGLCCLVNLRSLVSITVNIQTNA